VFDELSTMQPGTTRPDPDHFDLRYLESAVVGRERDLVRAFTMVSGAITVPMRDAGVAMRRPLASAVALLPRDDAALAAPSRSPMVYDVVP